MSNPVRLLVICLSLFTLSACDKLGLSDVAVIDLDAVAAATGQDEIIQQRIQAATQELDAQLQQIAAQLEAQLAEEKEKRGTMTEQEQQEMAQMTMQARQQFAQVQQEARQKAAQYRAGLIQEFTTQVKPIVAELAEKRGATTVFTESPTLFWHSASVDLTDEVIAEVRARGVSLESIVDGTDVAETEAAGAQ